MKPKSNHRSRGEACLALFSSRLALSLLALSRLALFAAAIISIGACTPQPALATTSAGIAAHRWDIATDRPAQYTIELYRGETINLEPRYLQYSQPLDLAGVYEVIFRYRGQSTPAGYYHAITGTVTDAAAGRIRINWTPAAETPDSAYTYTIAVKTLDGDTLRGVGGIRIRDTVGGLHTNWPVLYQPYDWATVEHLNLAAAPFSSHLELSIIQAQLSIIETSKVDVATYDLAIEQLQYEIDAAAAMAQMGGDIDGESTNARVTHIYRIPVAELFPGAEEDGYGLKYDHELGQLILGPVATEGTAISNILILSTTAQASDVAAEEIGIYRAIRPGNIPTAVVNVDGFEIVHIDALGLTLKSGSIHLLGSELAVNIAAYDGTAAAPAYSWGAQRDLGKYRMSYDGTYAEAFTIASNLVWYWSHDGIHLAPGAIIHGYAPTSDVAQIAAHIAAVSGRVDQVEIDLPLIAADVAAVSSRVDQIDVDIPIIAADIAAVSSRVDQIDIDLPLIAADIGAVSQRVDIVESWGPHAEAGYASPEDIEQIQSDLDGKYATTGGVVSGTVYAESLWQRGGYWHVQTNFSIEVTASGAEGAAYTGRYYQAGAHAGSIYFRQDPMLGDAYLSATLGYDYAIRDSVDGAAVYASDDPAPANKFEADYGFGALTAVAIEPGAIIIRVDADADAVSTGAIAGVYKYLQGVAFFSLPGSGTGGEPVLGFNSLESAFSYYTDSGPPWAEWRKADDQHKIIGEYSPVTDLGEGYLVATGLVTVSSPTDPAVVSNWVGISQEYLRSGNIYATNDYTEGYILYASGEDNFGYWGPPPESVAPDATLLTFGGTDIPQAALSSGSFVLDNGNLSVIPGPTNPVPSLEDVTGVGGRTIWPIYITGPDSTSTGVVGQYSFRHGYNVHAPGQYAHALGDGGVASGQFSLVGGYYSHAWGYNSFALGAMCEAGNFAFSAGWKGFATNDFSFVWQGRDFLQPTPEPYISKGPGTFGINPVGGQSGFYVGDTNLATIIQAAIAADRAAGISITNAWVDAAGVTNTQIYSAGLLTAWTQEGPGE